MLKNKKSKSKLLSLVMAIVMLVSFLFVCQVSASALEITTDNSYSEQPRNNLIFTEVQENMAKSVITAEDNITRVAHTLVWYSNASYVGYWRSSPTVYMYRVNGNTNFYNAMVQAIGIWERALGIDIDYEYLDNENQAGNNSGIFF